MITPLATNYIYAWADFLGFDALFSSDGIDPMPKGDNIVEINDSGLCLYYENNEWTVTKLVLIKGAARTLNDPGDPDTMDMEDLGTFKHLREALTCLGFHLVMAAIDVAEQDAQASIALDDPL